MKAIIAKQIKRPRCGECDGFHQDEDCGSCVNCKDMKKFGGRGIRKQAGM